jgi:predicted Rossmann-fold nucleotide-binding protein
MAKVVGVFGPSGANPYSAAARSLGLELAQHHLVLTGGTGIPDGSVKDQVLVGADAAITAGGDGGWIGIPKHGICTAVPDHGRGYLLQNPYGDERNYLNAFVAQSAIALKGGPGTDSEVAFAIALGHPVVLAGPGWEDVAAQLGRPATARAWLVEAIDRLFPRTESPGRTIDVAIAAARQACGSIKEIAVTAQPDLRETTIVAKTALVRAVRHDLAGLSDLVGAEGADRFARWLTSIRPGRQVSED